MKAYELKDIVSIYEPTSVGDGFGNDVMTYTLSKTIHAQVQFKSGTMTQSADELFSDERVDVITWSSATSAEAGWRVEYLGVMYRINSVERQPRKRLARFICGKVND